MMTTEFDWLYAMFARPVIPECMKVESPIAATVCFSFSPSPALLNPWMALKDAPMQSVISMAHRGGAAPSE